MAARLKDTTPTAPLKVRARGKAKGRELGRGGVMGRAKARGVGNRHRAKDRGSGNSLQAKGRVWGLSQRLAWRRTRIFPTLKSVFEHEFEFVLISCDTVPV